MRESLLDKKWKELTFVGFDTETTGAHPLGAEICEIAAVKYQNGEIIDKFSSFIKPLGKMDPVAQKIHGITIESLKTAPLAAEVLKKFNDFIVGSIGVAHHAPFDMGFIAYELEVSSLELPRIPVVCSSLLSRKIVKGIPNHKLQTLIPHLGIDVNAAHRALDDAKACLEVGIHCFEQMGDDTTLSEIIKKQGKNLFWKDFSIKDLKSATQKVIKKALAQNQDLWLNYTKGATPGKFRTVTPLGIVRNPDGDYMSGFCHMSQSKKRYYFEHIKEVKL